MQTAIKQHPILFSTPMVQAILEGRKKMTRRVVKAGVPLGNWEETMKKCPYGKAGDILWVRETWRIIALSWSKGYFTIQYKDGTKQMIEDNIDDLHAEKWINQCTEDAISAGRIFNDNTKMIENSEPNDFRWRPSIFMPKEACRLFLRITDIRVERLQNITEEDAIVEGVRRYPSGEYQFYMKDKLQSVRPGCDLARISFCSLWESINGPKSWQTNPFVWVVSFERIDKPE
jgi:hypothetical protein